MVNENLEFIISARDTASYVVNTLSAELTKLGGIGSAAFSRLGLEAQRAQLSFAKTAMAAEAYAKTLPSMAMRTEEQNLTQAQLNNQLAIAAQRAIDASAAVSTLAVASRAQAEAADFAAFGTNALAGAYGNAAREAAVFAAAQQKIAATAAAPGIAAVSRNADYAHVGTSEYQSAYLAGIAPNVMAAENAFARLGSSLEVTGGHLTRFGTRARQTGMNVTMGLTLPLAVVGGVSIASAVQFDTAMRQIIAQAGATREEIEAITPVVLDIAKVTPQGPVALAKALFEIESVGMHGAKALDTLAVASMGATTGQADLTKVTIALSSAMVSGISGAEDAGKTMATINSIVGLSRMHMDEFAQAMGSGILPVAKNLGLTLTDLGSIIGTLTDVGIPATQAATRLKTTLSLIAAPGENAVKVLKAIGIGELDLARAMRSGGSLEMLTLLKEKLDAYSTDPSVQFGILKEAFGGARSGGTLIALVEGLEILRQKQLDIAANSQKFRQDYEEMLDSFGVKWGIFISRLKVDAIILGNAVMPLALAFMNYVEPAISVTARAFENLNPKIRNILLIAAAIAIAFGPLLVTLGAIISSAGIVLTAFGAIASVLGLVTVEASGFAAAGAALLGSWAIVGVGIISIIGFIIAAIAIMGQDTEKASRPVLKLQLAWLDAEDKILGVISSIEHGIITGLLSPINVVGKALNKISGGKIDFSIDSSDLGKNIAEKSMDINERRRRGITDQFAEDWVNSGSIGGRSGGISSPTDLENLISRLKADVAAREEDYTGATELPDTSSSAIDKLSKTEFGLLSLAEAFKIFTDQTDSKSIPAFKAWLEMQEKLAEAIEQQAVRAEQARNPLLTLTMALGAIRTHVLEANTTIGMFLRDEVYKPALNAFKSALGELFSRPSRELQELNLKKLQLERQRMLDVNAGAGKKRLEYDDKQIAAVQRQIDLIENQNAQSKQMNELKDRTIKTEQEILDTANILGDFISQSSVKVNQFGDSAYFLTLTAINLSNAFNEQAANIRSGGSGAVATSGGPWGFASPQQAIDYFDASRIQVSASAAKSGDININLALQGQSPEQVKQEVMNALDNALVGASYGGGYTGGGSYSPV